MDMSCDSKGLSSGGQHRAMVCLTVPYDWVYAGMPHEGVAWFRTGATYAPWTNHPVCRKRTDGDWFA